MIKRIVVAVLLLSTLQADALEKAMSHYWNREYAAALKQFQRLADQGNKEAAYRLANMYEFGIGTGTDNSLAHHYYLLAANRGDTVSMYIVAMHHFRGRGAEGSMDKCVYWLKRAARNGNKKAAYNLGYFYEHGTGSIEKSRYLANYWYKIAQS